MTRVCKSLSVIVCAHAVSVGHCEAECKTFLMSEGGKRRSENVSDLFNLHYLGVQTVRKLALD